MQREHRKTGPIVEYKNVERGVSGFENDLRFW